MNASATPSMPDLSQELTAALEWWRDAGVDNDFADDATAWLEVLDTHATQQPIHSTQKPTANPAKIDQEPPRKASAPAIERQDFFAEERPSSLEAFRDFWMSAPGLDAIGPRGRIAPRGSQGAELMILVVDPEVNDSDHLLSGAQGTLLNRMLSAMMIAQDQVYIASALPRPTPMADTQALAQSGLDTVLQHHIDLVAPKRLIAFGAGLVPFLGHKLNSDATSSPDSNQSSSIPPILMSEGLDALIDMPPLKARFWRKWIKWSAIL